MNQYDPEKFLHREITERIIGVYYHVYNELGHGFLEAVYQRAMTIALGEAELRANDRLKIVVRFRGHQVGEYVPDLLVDDKVIVELKAVESLTSSHESQLMNYLKATDCEVGLLLNFGPKVHIKRFAFSNERKKTGRHASTESGKLVSDSNRVESA